MGLRFSNYFVQSMSRLLISPSPLSSADPATPSKASSSSSSSTLVFSEYNTILSYVFAIGIGSRVQWYHHHHHSYYYTKIYQIILVIHSYSIDERRTNDKQLEGTVTTTATATEKKKKKRERENGDR